MKHELDLEVVAAVNNQKILDCNLGESQICRINNYPLHKFYGCTSIGEAYNKGLDASTSEIVVFAHQDVYFPTLWLRQLHDAILTVNKIDARWAVLGVYGVSGQGIHVGYCWSSGLGKILGAPLPAPQPVVSVDELVIVMRRTCGLRFDEKLPGFHLYGTDIVQTCLEQKFGAYVIHAPVIHNSVPVKSLSGSYSRSYRYMQRKWKEFLPLPNSVVAVTRFGYPLRRYNFRRTIKNILLKNTDSVSILKETGEEIAKRIRFDPN